MSEEYFSKLKKVDEDSPEAKLFHLLDDIDTAGDMFKPDNDSAYVQFIYRKVRAAHDIITSDGYDLYYFDPEVEYECAKPTTPGSYVSETELMRH